MLKTFDEMRKVDVRPFCEMRKAKDDHGHEIDVPYLNWAKCLDLLHENGATDVWFEPVVNANGSSLIMSEKSFSDKNGNVNQCYEVRVHIKVDDLEWDAQYPLMNGSNPVKDNSMSQQRVWNAQTRAFVKGVAMRTGLGFDLWLKEQESRSMDDDLSQHNIMAVKQRAMIAYTRLIKKGLTTKEIATSLNKTEDEVKYTFTMFDQLARFEEALNKL